jgi:purine-nucleoside phosphorylase
MAAKKVGGTVNREEARIIYQYLLDAHAGFGTEKADVCRLLFKVEPGEINEEVIIAPFWAPHIFEGLVEEIRFLSEANFRRLWTLSAEGRKITYLLSGVGSPVILDAVFALSCTPCKRIIFIGAVGALDKAMELGDIIIPEYSISGDGASRYVTSNRVGDNDCYGQRCYPDPEFFGLIRSVTESIARDYGVSWHIGRTFSVDTIFAEFGHLEEFLQLGCDSIEMESAALFKAAQVSGIRAGAVFTVSDNVYRKKQVYARTREDIERINHVRDWVLSRIVLGRSAGTAEKSGPGGDPGKEWKRPLS